MEEVGESRNVLIKVLSYFKMIALITQLALKAANLRNATIAAVLQAEVNRSICEETFYPARNK